AIKARRHAGFGIQNERADKRRRVVSTLLQNLWNVRQQRRESVTEIRHGMKLWIRPGEDRGMGDRSERSLRVGALKDNALTGHNIEIRCQSALRAEKPHPVGARGIDRDEYDIGSLSPGPWTCSEYQQPDQEGTPHTCKKGVYHLANSAVLSSDADLRSR